MTTAKKIEQIVSEIPADFVFTYRDLGLTAEDSANVIKKLNRLAESGVISKLSKGRYFKPKKSIFGALNPSVEEVVKDLLERNGNIIGYLTNYSVYSQLGLTSQIPNIIVIGSNTKRSKTRRGNTEIRFVLQRNEITKANIYLLQLLDVIKSIKNLVHIKGEKQLESIKGEWEKDGKSKNGRALNRQAAYRRIRKSITEFAKTNVKIQLATQAFNNYLKSRGK